VAPDRPGADVRRGASRTALLLAEGYATASLHEATGHPVAVAFDAGNLVHVAKALRALYPGPAAGVR
jgi:putative DNA primase/helicase